MATDNTNDFFEESRKELSAYLDLRLKLLQLDSAEKLARASGALVSLIILLVMFFILINIGVFLCGLVLSDWFGSYLKGFSLMGGIYLIVFVILFIFRKQLMETPVMNHVIRIMFNEGV